MEDKNDDDREQCALLYDASRPGTVLQKISRDQQINLTYNVQNVHAEAGAQMSFGPTLIQDASLSALHNEMDCLRHFRADFRELFVPTLAFIDSLDVLENHHALVVTGSPGMGKTFISQQLLLKFCDEKQCNPFQPDVPEEYKTWLNTRERQVFLMDDVFGASNFNETQYLAWISVFPKMVQHLRSLNTFLIFICRYNILKPHLQSLMKFEFFKNIINLSDEKYQLTIKIKIDLFENHISKFKVNVNVNEVNLTRQRKCVGGNALSLPDPIGFPQCVRLFCSMKNVSRNLKLKYFHCPMEFLSDVIGSFREENQLSYCILIMLLINDGRLPVNRLHPAEEPSDELKWCMRMSKVKMSKAMSLHDAADSLCGSLLIRDHDSYVYQHPSIMEAVTLDFGKRYPSDILDRCSIPFLLERVFTQRSAPPDNEYVVILRPGVFPKLCDRLVNDITRYVNEEDDSLSTLSAYAVFKDGSFNRVFLHHLQDTDNLHLLLTSSSSHSQHPTFTFFAAASGQNALVEEFLSSHRRALEQLPGFRDHLDRILYAASNSGSAAAVKALLSAGAQADYMTAHSPDHVGHLRWWYEPPTCTTLMHAAYSGSVGVMMLIIDHLQKQRVDVVMKSGISDGGGMTALHWWAVGGRGEPDGLKILLEAGADLNVRDNEGWTALHQSAWLGNETIVRALLEAGVDIHARDKEGHTALYWSRQGNDTVIHTLLKGWIIRANKVALGRKATVGKSVTPSERSYNVQHRCMFIREKRRGSDRAIPNCIAQRRDKSDGSTLE